MRAYVPATVELLARYVEAGTVPLGTDAVVAAEESEDAEYDAFEAAAAAALALLAGPGRRVVLVVEAGPADEVPVAEVLAVHADTEDVDPAADDPAELAWFATQEIPALLG